VDPEKTWPRNARPWLFEGEKAAHLADEGEAMGPRRLRLAGSAGDEVPDHSIRDYGIVRGQVCGQETVELVEDTSFFAIAIPCRALEIQEPGKLV
jgi:hypothetical protein